MAVEAVEGQHRALDAVPGRVGASHLKAANELLQDVDLHGRPSLSLARGAGTRMRKGRMKTGLAEGVAADGASRVDHHAIADAAAESLVDGADERERPAAVVFCIAVHAFSSCLFA